MSVTIPSLAPNVPTAGGGYLGTVDLRDPIDLLAEALLRRWGALHAVRSVLGVLAFGTFVMIACRAFD